MPKYKVTGGDDGESGIEFSGKRYEAGSTVEMPTKKAEWLVEIGILEASGKGSVEPKIETQKAEDECPHSFTAKEQRLISTSLT